MRIKPDSLHPSAVYRVEVKDPKGAAMERMTTVFQGKAPEPLRFALSDAAGIYQVVLTDVRTGLQAEEQLKIGQ